MAHGSLKWPPTGAILCGGRSSRMGAPKHDLKMPDGRTMIELVVETVGQVCQKIVISGPDDILPDLPHVPDLRKGQGPLGGLEALLASGRDEHYLVVPCDLPLLKPVLLRKLLIETSASATVFQVEGREQTECMPIRISATTLIEVGNLLDSGCRAVHRLLDEIEVEFIPLTSSQAESLVNVNTADDYQSMLDRVGD